MTSTNHISKDSSADDGSELAALRSLLTSVKQGPTPEQITKQRSLDLRINAPKVNAWAGGPSADKAGYWTVFIDPTPPSDYSNYSGVLCGLDFESTVEDVDYDDDTKGRSWVSYNLRFGFNFLSPKYFQGEFDKRQQTANDMIESKKLWVVPPGASLPSGVLSGEVMKALVDQAMLGDRDVASLRFLASLLPVSAARSQLEAKAARLEADGPGLGVR